MPVTGFKYGPMEFSEQEARIKIGALSCEPPYHAEISTHIRFYKQRRKEKMFGLF